MSIALLSLPYPGVCKIAQHGADLGLWQFIKIEGSFDIPPADVYLLGAWSNFYEQFLPHLNGRVGIIWTSSVGEVGFEPLEIGYLHTILNNPKIEFILFGDQSLAGIFKEKGIYIPYPIAGELVAKDIPKEDIITLFCPSGHKKSIANQLAAVSLLQQERDIILHTNITGHYRDLLLLFGVKHQLYGWLPDDDYYKLLAAAKVNLSVSFAETFSYQTAECCQLGTPSVVSPTITWYKPKSLVVSNPNNPLEIKNKILYALDNYRRLADQAKENIKIVADTQNATLINTLKQHNLL